MNYTNARHCAVIISFVAAIMLSSFAGCRPASIARSTMPPAPCDSNLMCTMDFRSVPIWVLDAKGDGILLDSFVSVLKTDGRVLTSSADNYMLRGAAAVYPVASDNHLSVLRREGKEVEFNGFVRGRKIVQHTLTIGHDCCHVKLLAGADTVRVPAY